MRGRWTKWNEFMFAPEWLNSAFGQNDPDVHFLHKKGFFNQASWCFFNLVQKKKKADFPRPLLGLLNFGWKGNFKTKLLLNFSHLYSHLNLFNNN